MNIEDLAFLTDHVSTIDGQRPERLAEVQGRIRTARRRRAAAAVSGAAALAAAVFAIASVVPGSSEHSAPPVDQPTVTPIEEPAAHLPALPTTTLAPGTYQFSVVANPGAEPPDALVEVPSGFDGGGDWYVVSHDGYQFLGVWTVEKVERDACRRELNDSFAPGPTLEDLADALVAQKSTHATAPEQVTLAGYQGLYVELASPRDVSKCDPNPGLWREPGERGIYSDGQIDLLWILDVDGQRLVVNAAYSLPKSTASDIGKLTSMVESLKFEAAAPE